MNIFNKNRKTASPLVAPGEGGLVENPTKNDVLCGRGKRVNAHVGNKYFREVVQRHKLQYLATSKVEKSQIAALVVDEIRSLDPPGRFLKEDSESNKWLDIGDEKARKKAGQALREDAPEIRTKMDPKAFDEGNVHTDTAAVADGGGDDDFGRPDKIISSEAKTENDRRMSTLSMDSSLVALLQNSNFEPVEETVAVENKPPVVVQPKLQQQRQRTYSPHRQRNYSPHRQRTHSPHRQRTYSPTPPSQATKPGSSDNYSVSFDCEVGSKTSSSNKTSGSKSSSKSGSSSKSSSKSSSGEGSNGFRRKSNSPMKPSSFAMQSTSDDQRRRSSITMDSEILQAILSQNFLDEPSITDDTMEQLSAKMSRQSICENGSLGILSESNFDGEMEEDLEADLEAIKNFVQRLPNTVQFSTRASMAMRRESHMTAMSIDSTVVETMLRRSFVQSKRRNSEATVESFLEGIGANVASVSGRVSVQQDGQPQPPQEEMETVETEDDDDDNNSEGQSEEDDATRGDYKRRRRFSRKPLSIFGRKA